MPEAEIRFATDEEYEILRTIRDRHGVMWRGMLIQGARQVEGYDLRKALLQLDPVTLDSAADYQSHSVRHRRASSEQRTRLDDRQPERDAGRNRAARGDRRADTLARQSSDSDADGKGRGDAIGIDDVRSLLSRLPSSSDGHHAASSSDVRDGSERV